MRPRLQFLVLPGLLAHIASADLVYKSPTGNCQTSTVIGKAQCCCDGQCTTGTSPWTWGTGCADYPNSPVCANNQIFQQINSTNFDSGGECYHPGLCNLQNWQYTYNCCDCPAGYISTAAPPNCDHTASCVGCSNPGEDLTGNSTSNYKCTVAASSTPTLSPTSTPSCSPGAQFHKCTPSGDTCDFYTCLESEYHCEGTKYSYPLDYGLKYCNKYTQNMNMFSPAGKQWIHNVRLCLQNALLPDTDCKSSCQKVQDDAFKSHPACYVDNGVCTLYSDWIHIVQTVGIDGLLAGGSQVADTIELCIAQYEGMAKSKLLQAMFAVAAFLAQAGSDVSDAILRMITGQLRARLLRLALSVGVPIAGL